MCGGGGGVLLFCFVFSVWNMGRASFKGNVRKRKALGEQLGDQRSSLGAASPTSRPER